MEILRKKLMQIKRNIVYFDECFTIKVLSTRSNASGTLNFNTSFRKDDTIIQYSKNNEATINTYNNIGITVNNGDKIKIYAELKGIMPEWPSVDDSNFSSFIQANFSYEVYGNLNSLVYGIYWNDGSISEYNLNMCSKQQFANLFANDINIENAKNLVFPYTEYNSCACYHMFNNCSNLKYGPEYLGYAYPKFDINNIDKGDDPINVISLVTMGQGYGSMYGMFENCTSMIKGPECLYLDIHLYKNPKNGGSYYPNYPGSNCNPNYNNNADDKGLITDLPKFFGGHLSRMFYNCTSLTEAPKILLLDAYPSSCAGMFGNNTYLKLIELYIGNISLAYEDQLVGKGDTCLGLFLFDNDYTNNSYGNGIGGITFSDDVSKVPDALNIHYYINPKYEIGSTERTYVTGDTRAWPTTDGISTSSVGTTEITELPSWIPYIFRSNDPHY